jgi:hypothetical protein
LTNEDLSIKLLDEKCGVYLPNGEAFLNEKITKMLIPSSWGLL